MIPKKIHYCWFGKNPLPESVKKCIKSWEKYCPDYEIVEWNENNYNVYKIKYIQDAYENKKYAFVSDYARLDIIYHEGGIYLDTDVELIKSLDSLLYQNFFMGMELVGSVNTGIGFGAEKNTKFLLENMAYYENMTKFDKSKTCVDITTNLLREKGLKKENRIQKIEGVVIYPTEYFCPYNMETRKTNITLNTYSIHHYDATWYSDKKIIRELNKFILPLKIKSKNLINRLFGENTYEKIKSKVKGEK